MLKISAMKKYNLFIFFTMFAKFSVELFMPVILYKLNFSITDILFFLLLSYIINILGAIPTVKLGSKFGYKYLILASTFLFVGLYFFVSFMHKSIFGFLTVCLLSSLTNTLYYLSRHVYAGIVLEKKQVARGVGSILISTILASIMASILSSLMLDQISFVVLAIVVTIIYLIGIVFIFLIPKKTRDVKLDLKKVHKEIPLVNKIFFFLEQFKIMFFTLYPLYVYIFVDNTYSFIGLLYIITGLASIIFVYFFSHYIAKGKANYLKISALFLSAILLLDMYVDNHILYLIIVFLEGIAIKLYETSVTNNMYLMQGEKEASSYFLYMELLYNISRIIIVIFILLFKLKIRTILLMCLFFIFISGFIKMNFQEKK